MNTRTTYNGYTVEISRPNVTQVHALIDTVVSTRQFGSGPPQPICDVQRAATIAEMDPEWLECYVGRLHVALCHIGAYLINEEMLECERMAADPRAEEIKVHAFWGYGAEFAREMTLAEALRMHANYRSTEQPDSGVAITRATSYWVEDDSINDGHLENGVERSSESMVDVGRRLLRKSK